MIEHATLREWNSRRNATARSYSSGSTEADAEGLVLVGDFGIVGVMLTRSRFLVGMAIESDYYYSPVLIFFLFRMSVMMLMMMKAYLRNQWMLVIDVEQQQPAQTTRRLCDCDGEEVRHSRSWEKLMFLL